jgi:UDP-2,3-diacylglucosamine pyrophosphatase LpxH
MPAKQRKKETPAEVVILSDLHLGSFGARTKEILSYLNQNQPKKLILNGDIIDAWQFKKKHFQALELSILQRIIDLALSGTEVIYLTGNHDEFLRSYVPLQLNHLILENKYVLELEGKKYWCFHGDIFDHSVSCSKWLARLGGRGYDFLIWMNHTINQVLQFFKQPRWSFSKHIKESVKRAVKYVSDFEQVAIDLAAEQGFDGVICGHIHMPQNRKARAANGRTIHYLNSGDWVENCSALEFKEGRWELNEYADTVEMIIEDVLQAPTYEELFQELLGKPSPSVIPNL